MKHLLSFYVFFLLSVQLLISQEINIDVFPLHWENSYKKAQKKSKKEHKPILIYFTGSDWCGPCKILDKNLFHTQKFEEFASENLILYKADMPRNKDLVNNKIEKINNKLSKKYHQKSFPTIIMVDYNGKELGVKRGMYIIEYYFPFFESIIKEYESIIKEY